MFRAAIQVASGFTRPVVVSSKTVAGTCQAGIGAFVIVNKDGWFVTADHIIGQLQELLDSCDRVAKLKADRATVEQDATIDAKAKRKQLARMKHPDDAHVEEFATWWGGDGLTVVDIKRLPQIDLAVGRLTPFDPTLVPAYPVFKNPSISFTIGASLCRLGFPFYDLSASWDATTRHFILPPTSVPIPLFAIDGILSRMINFPLPPAQPGLVLPSFAWKMIETSSPGLRGQSGGPVFDAGGRIWGIQSSTKSYPLGFDPDVPGGKRGDKEHQFLNVGWGIHSETVTGMLADLKVPFDQSTD